MQFSFWKVTQHVSFWNVDLSSLCNFKGQDEDGVLLSMESRNRHSAHEVVNR